MQTVHLFLNLLVAVALCASCSRAPQTTNPSDANRPPVLTALHPAFALAGARFTAQPDGESALAVDCERATSTTVIVFGEERLKTVFGSERLLTATVPAILTVKAGSVIVRLENEAGKSNELAFELK